MRLDSMFYSKNFMVFLYYIFCFNDSQKKCTLPVELLCNPICIPKELCHIFGTGLFILSTREYLDMLVRILLKALNFLHTLAKCHNK